MVPRALSDLSAQDRKQLRINSLMHEEPYIIVSLVEIFISVFIFREISLLFIITNLKTHNVGSNC